MKRMPGLVFGLGVLVAAAQAVNAQDAQEPQLSTRLGKAISMSSNAVKANEIVKGKVVYSGLAVAVIKKDNPLQLFNPFAPATYSSAEVPALRDPGTAGTGSARPWKLFSIQF